MLCDKKNVMRIVILQHGTYKMFRFPENLCMDIECLDVHVEFYFRFF
jgi:hypothetical protein